MNQKDISYFQSTNIEKDLEQIAINNKYVAKIQAGDILSVMVSSLSPEASIMFNPYQSMATGVQTPMPQPNTPTPAMGYLIDDEGFISLPLIGKLKIENLTTQEARDLLTEKLEKYLQQPTVNLRILNFKITVLGEVNRPSVYTIPNEKISLPEVLSLAGDLTIFGKRSNIMVIRETNGKWDFARIDMTKRDMFSSPFYYLHSNDIIYVEPTKGRITSSDRTIQLAPIIISGLTLITLIIANLAK